jgi:alpha-tubulin suppressor-like RCC1 family protein
MALYVKHSDIWKQIEIDDDIYEYILYSCGENASGQLCLSNRINKSTPTQAGLSNWEKIQAGRKNVCLINFLGELYSCGDNYYGELGLNLASSGANKSTFTQIGSSTNWSDVSCGQSHCLAINLLGQLYSWGYNNYGQLGFNDIINRSSITQVGTDTDWETVACGMYTSFAIKTNGTLYGWGDNGSGQLGLDDAINRSTPSQIGVSSNWSKVSPGYLHTIFIDSSNYIYSCGSNVYGQLGQNDTVSRSSPIQIGTSAWDHVVCTVFSSYSVDLLGQLYVWGRNNYGQLGLNDTVSRSSPIQVFSTPSQSWISLSPGGDMFLLFINSQGQLWGCGKNTKGQLGLNNVVHRSTFTQIGTDTNWKLVVTSSCTDAFDYNNVFAIKSLY